MNNRIEEWLVKRSKMTESNSGMALVIVLMAMALILCSTGARLFFTGLNLRTSSNFKTGRSAMYAADTGIQHALATIPLGTDFNALLAGTVDGFPLVSGKPTLSGSVSGYTYSVVVGNDTSVTGETTTTDNNRIVILTSTATDTKGSQSRVTAYIGRSGSPWAPPGTVLIPGGANSDTNFNTTGTFFITGNDTSYSGDSNHDGRADSTSAGPNAPIYGVTSPYDSMVSQFMNSLSSTEKTRVQGNGYNAATSPVTPSVFKTTITFSVADLVDRFKSYPGAVQYPNGLSLNSSSCPTPPPNPPSATCTLGTDSSPQITYIKAESGTIKFDSNSTVTGSGVLILDGKANVFGNFEFHGLVISLVPGLRGDESTEDNLKLKFKNDARIFGSLVLGPRQAELKFDIKDRAAIYYSRQALNLVTSHWNSLLPQPAILIAWHELMN